MRKRASDFNLRANAIQIKTVEVSKGLKCPVEALPGMRHMPAEGEDEQEAARVSYVAATGATQRLLITVDGESGFDKQLSLQVFTKKGSKIMKPAMSISNIRRSNIFHFAAEINQAVRFMYFCDPHVRMKGRG